MHLAALLLLAADSAPPLFRNRDEVAAAILALGFDSTSKRLATRAVEGAIVSWGATHSVNVYLAQSTFEFADALDISGNIEVSTLAPGFGVSAKASFFEAAKGSSASTYLVVSARNYVTYRLRDPRILSDGSVTTPDKANFTMGDFLSTHGDSFVDEVKLGGEYYCVYTFETRSRQEQLAVSAALAANGIVSGLDISGEVAVDFAKAVGESQTTFKVRSAVVRLPRSSGSQGPRSAWRAALVPGAYRRRPTTTSRASTSPSGSHTGLKTSCKRRTASAASPSTRWSSSASRRACTEASPALGAP